MVRIWCTLTIYVKGGVRSPRNRSPATILVEKESTVIQVRMPLRMHLYQFRQGGWNKIIHLGMKLGKPETLANGSHR